MEEIKNSNFRFDENQKIKLYQFMTQTESKVSDQHILNIIDEWRKIVQNAQQKKQLKELYHHKIEILLDSLSITDEKIMRRINHLKKLTADLWE